jgi:hypothetical protein
LQGSFPSQLARKILTLAFSCACPVYFIIKGPPHA